MTTTSSMRGWMAVAVGMWLWPLPARPRAHPRGRRAPAAERTASRERRSPSAVMVGELVGGEASRRAPMHGCAGAAGCQSCCVSKGVKLLYSRVTAPM